MTQERFSVGSRNPIALTSAARFPHSDRTFVQLSMPGLIVTTRKMAALVSRVATGCGIGRELPAAAGVVIGSDSNR
jgi:hypothetical protein